MPGDKAKAEVVSRLRRAADEVERGEWGGAVAVMVIVGTAERTLQISMSEMLTPVSQSVGLLRSAGQAIMEESDRIERERLN